MSKVQVIQRSAVVVGTVALDYVKGRNGMLAKAVFAAACRERRSAGDSATVPPVKLQWTAWGRLAETLAQCLVDGSHVNVVGYLRSRAPRDNDATSLTLDCVCGEVDFLESRADKAARTPKDPFTAEMEAEEARLAATRPGRRSH